ncbi:alpha/beta fold hydrolase [Poseidonocella sp. HB161398]|uniref:alpha/beta fold hydrolase n=1 Tax=Poseidonocella sp. HB161398 TaxID=2320855 RepID=UPI001109F9CA|nr:alpha/beta hydrolase [Poseidonocella sp. HB161398]
MARIKAGEITLGQRQWGDGPIPVLFIHGNLASKDWIEVAAQWFPPDMSVYAVDWRGCGDSDRPTPDDNYDNYSITQHAEDMLAAMDTLGIGCCHLVTHSTGGIIAARMQLIAPERIGRILHLDPVSPMGIRFEESSIAAFRAMEQSKQTTRAVMANAASSLFQADSFLPGKMPKFRDGIDHLQSMFEKVIDQTFTAGHGIWLGTPLNLTKEAESGELAAQMDKLVHETLIVWGQQDGIIQQADMRAMAEALPDARLVEVPGVGHSMNIEAPQMFAGYVAGFLSGIRPAPPACLSEGAGAPAQEPEERSPRVLWWHSRTA